MKSKPTETNLTSIPEYNDKIILVVDDSPISRRILVHILKPMGTQILYAEDGKQALTLMREHSPHLVFMDMQMPVMDGYEATRQAKADPSIASIPIIALTGGETNEDYKLCQKAGCDGYLPKPVSQPQLLKAMNKFFSNGRESKPANISSSNGMTNTTQSVDTSWILQISEAIRNEYLPQLRELIAEHETTALRRFGHTMKGIGRQFQMEALAEWGETFEKSAETLLPEALQQQFEQFQTISQDILGAATSKTKES